MQAQLQQLQAFLSFFSVPVSLQLFDLQGALESVPFDELGISIIDQPCVEYASLQFEEVEDVCANPGRYAFYDVLHFTTAVHEWLASKFAEEVDRNKTRMESSAGLSLGGLSLGG